jgi:murein DD-endopeptidase MepM/ murein hydrolase activator NlpD
MTKIYKNLLFVLFCSIFVFCDSSAFVYGQTTTILNREVKSLNSEISDRKSRIKEIQEQQAEYSESIKKMQSDRASLNNQIAILDNRVAKAELDIEMTELELEKVKLEIQKTDLEIEEKNEEIEKEKKHIANVIRLLYKKEKTTPLEIILVNDSLGDFLNQVKYLEDVSEEVEDSLQNLEGLKRELERNKEDLDEQKLSFEDLKNELVMRKDKLEAEKENKNYLLVQVNSSERQYQNLLVQAREEQQAVAADIASMEKRVRQKLAQIEGEKLEFNDNGMTWPVTKNTITAYFHDPEYPYRHIFEHPAVDIRAGQGSTLKAAASGYVAKAVTGGATGYGYIMIVHGDGLSTVYGHVSKIYVNVDDYVVQGQTIGLSGGMPGTPGAGRLTTGPHLHFEVRLNGIPVNPLNYLP